MAVITKKIGKKFYAYLSNREGNNVVHKYLGPIGDPETQKKILSFHGDTVVPEKFCSLFWDAKCDDIDLRRNASYIIERVLELGGLEAMEWLQRTYTTKRILQVLVLSRALSRKSRNFWSLWFGLEDS